MIFGYILRRLKPGFGWHPLLLACTPTRVERRGGQTKHDMDAVDTKLHKSKIAGPPLTGYIAACYPDVR